MSFLRIQDEEYYEKIKELMYSDKYDNEPSFSSFNELNNDEKMKKVLNIAENIEEKSSEARNLFDEPDLSFFDKYKRDLPNEDFHDPSQALIDSEEEREKLAEMNKAAGEEEEEELDEYGDNIKDYTSIRKALLEAEISEDEMPNLEYLNKLVTFPFTNLQEREQFPRETERREEDPGERPQEETRPETQIRHRRPRRGNDSRRHRRALEDRRLRVRGRQLQGSRQFRRERALPKGNEEEA